MKRGVNAFAKSIDPYQPARIAQADMGRNFLLPLNNFASQRITDKMDFYEWIHFM